MRNLEKGLLGPRKRVKNRILRISWSKNSILKRMKIFGRKGKLFLTTGIALCASQALASETSAFIGTKISAGFYGAPKASVFATDTVDHFSSSWLALQIPLETGRQYEQTIEPFFSLFIGGTYEDFSIYFDFPLRKDIEAWYEDDLSTNTTIVPDNLDINVPTNAYAKWDYGVGFVQAGRFKPELGPSPNSLTLGGAPYHDAFLWKFCPGFLRYDFFLSSLNAHLHGTPDVVGGKVDSTTEVWKQANLQIDNQRKRQYTDPYKTLVYHRLGVDFKHFWFYVIEQSVIGGKQVEFRTLNPFMFWHNNYATGYTKSNATLELGLRPNRLANFYYQLAIDEVKSPVGETGENSNRGITSHMVGYNQQVKTERYGDFNFRLDAVLTDPAAGNERLPLLKYTSRRMYRSNYRDQSDADFADMFFVDYPLGYRRGPDAKDLWFTVDWLYGRHSLALELAWLRQGDKDLMTDYDVALQSKRTLSGIVERQYVADLTYGIVLWKGFAAKLGGGIRRYKNLDHISGENGYDLWGIAGISWDFRYKKIF